MRKHLLAFLLACLLGSSVHATWSIVVVNRRTGEVAVGSATCLQSINLTQGLPVLRIGKGAGAIQAASGGSAGLLIMFDQFGDDVDSATLLAAVLAADPSPMDRQIGLVSMVGFPQTFTGTSAGRARGGVQGEFGDYAYAIQGNVITGSAVFREARNTLIATPGDLAEKLMAAMETARFYGGDGRCSCDQNRPFSCGSPPPSFTKSAHVGFMLIGRIGDPDAPCSNRNGNDCATAQYYMRLNVAGNSATASSPDPVFQLRDQYDEWRADHVGRPDGTLSTIQGVQSLPADGRSQRSFTVQLRDIDGNPLTSGGAEVLVSPAPGSLALSSIGDVKDNGDGSYSFVVTSGSSPGQEQLMVSADDGYLKATLFPYLDLRSDAVSPLHVGYDSLSAAQNPAVPMVVQFSGAPEERFFLLASLAGSSPGTQVGELLLPLNRPLLHPYVGHQQSPTLSGQVGHLDATGRAELSFQPDPLVALALVGRRVDWCAILLRRGALQATPAAGYNVLP